ncbi:MAG: c-type cytochrome [Acidimicrobiales bacterium]
MFILAASTQRTIGLVIALVVAGGFAIYVLVNLFKGKAEIGSEIELAPNRKPYLDDEELETKKLDISLAAGVVTLAIIAVALPLYWLGEPGRQEGYIELTSRQSADRGGEQYEELCVNCHGAEGVGGATSFTVLDEEGRFIATVNWAAPALNNIMYRFSEDEVLHVLNFGRPQSPMPAWGAPGGGPLTEQQVEELIDYLRRIQVPSEQLRIDVQQGLRTAVFDAAREANPEPFETLASLQADPDSSAEEVAAAQAAVDASLDGYIDDIATNNQVGYGELLFDLDAGAGSYACARCHTEGASWNSDEVLAENPELAGLIEPQVPGGGAFGPSLIGVEDQFLSAQAQSDFVSAGCSPNLQYGENGVCEPSGQMPGFGPDATEFARDHAGSMLLPDQIDAIVAYERNLG